MLRCSGARGPALGVYSMLNPDVATPTLHASVASDRVPFWARIAVVGALVLANTAIYLLSNTHPVRAPTVLHPNSLDLLLGWHAWTIWPYWLLLALAPAMALSLHSGHILWLTLRAYATALAVNLSIWLLWPTRVVRAALPAGLDSATAAAWRWLYAIDAPNNCFPSGHVTIPLVVAAGFCAQHPGARRWPFVAIVVLLPSVVTTGQHTSWDVLGGTATAVLGLLLASPALLRAQWRPNCP